MNFQNLLNFQPKKKFDYSSLIDLPEEDDYEDIQNPYQNQYMSKLMEQPKAEDYGPSTGRRIIAGLLGGLTGLRDPRAGVATAQQIITEPYSSAVTRHKSELEPVEDLYKAGEVDVESKRRQMKDKMGNIIARNKYALSVMKEMQNHETQMARLQDMKDDNTRAEKIAAETERYHKALEKNRNDHLNFVQSKANRDERFRSMKEDRLEGHRLTREGLARERLDKDRVTPQDQAKIDDLATKQVSSDPRFSKWFSPDLFGPGKGGFSYEIKKGSKTIETMDDDTEAQIQQALAKAKEEIANKRRQDYIKTDFEIDDMDEENDDDEDDFDVVWGG